MNSLTWLLKHEYRDPDSRKVGISHPLGGAVSVSRVRAKGQITLPREIREAAHIEEGDPIGFELTADGILLRPQKVIDSTQAWFWQDAWQAGEQEASSDIREGRVEVHSSADDLLKSLDQ